MSFKMNLCTASTILCALAGTAQASVSYNNSFSTGNSTFGVAASLVGDTGFYATNSQVHFRATGEFRGTLIGLSKNAVLSFGGWNNPSDTKLDMSLSIDGYTLASQSKQFNNVQGTFTLPSFTFFAASKQFVVWGVPVVVMVDVDSVAVGQYLKLVVPSSVSNPFLKKTVWAVNGSIGATGTLTMGPGTSLIGAGVYGTTTLGKTKASANRSKVQTSGASWKYQLLGALYYGGIDIGLTAWIDNLQVSLSVYEVAEESVTLIDINH